MTTSSPCGVAEEALWSLVEVTEVGDGIGHNGLADHAASCPHCRGRLADLRRVRDGLEGLSVQSAELPERIGRYRVLRLIGEGAMGVVCEAEQDRPARKVAIKVLRPQRQLDDRALRAFRREVEALARLHHPAIAAIHDAGQTESGQPFFAMQLVEGKPVDRYLAAAKAGPREVSALMARVAQAVHFAHQRGILHRDLKPAHVLVDASGDPHVLDFGLARALHDDAGLSLSLTGQRVVGTLPYMSPEQARGDAGAVDTRSDVYALGVMLYELLVGQRPYDVPSHVVAAARVIQEARPVHPSEQRAQVPSELGDVVLKALAKEPDRRYASAAALADDLERFLSGEAVSARPASPGYRLRVFVRQHRALVAAASLALAALAVGLGATLLALREAERERRDAEQATALLSTALEAGDPLLSANPDPSLRGVMDELAARLAEGGFRPDSLHEARLRETLGRAYRHLDQPALGEPHLRRALAIRQRVLGLSDAATAGTAYELAITLTRQRGRGREVRELASAALAALEEAGQTGSLVEAKLLHVLGWRMVGEDYQVAERTLRRAERIAAACPESTDREVLRAWCLNELCSLAGSLGEDLVSERYASRGVDILRRVSPVHPHLASMLVHLAGGRARRGDPDSQAENVALREERDRVCRHWGVRLSRQRCAIGLARGGDPERAIQVLGVVGREGDAAGVIEVQWGGFDGERGWPLDRAQAYLFSWAACLAAGRSERAAEFEPLYRDTVAVLAQLQPPASTAELIGIAWQWFEARAVFAPSAPLESGTPVPDGPLQELLERAWRGWRASDPLRSRRCLLFADLLEWTGHHGKAARVLVELAEREPSEWDLDGPIGARGHNAMHDTAHIVRAMVRLDRLDQADATARRLLDHFDRRLGTAHAARPEFSSLLAEVCARRGALAEAETLYRGALDELARSHGETNRAYALAQRDRAAVLRRLGRADEAAPELERALEVLTWTHGPWHWEVAAVHHELGLCLQSLGRHDDGADHLARAARIRRHVFGGK